MVEWKFIALLIILFATAAQARNPTNYEEFLLVEAKCKAQIKSSKTEGAIVGAITAAPVCVLFPPSCLLTGGAIIAGGTGLGALSMKQEMVKCMEKALKD
jgi:hypothetical protein